MILDGARPEEVLQLDGPLRLRDVQILTALPIAFLEAGLTGEWPHLTPLGTPREVTLRVEAELRVEGRFILGCSLTLGHLH